MTLCHSFHVYSFYYISGLSLEKMLLLPSQKKMAFTVEVTQKILSPD